MSLLRAALLRASTSPWLASRLPRRRFVKRAVRRFMPGESAEDALREAGVLARRGVPTVVTILGENVETADETRAVVQDYARVASEARSRGLDLELSIKPTHLGLDQDPDLAFENVSRLAAEVATDAAVAPDAAVATDAAGAPDAGATLWMDMESSAYVDPTLELFRRLRTRHENVGLCLQSYLRRAVDDLEGLLPLGPRIRLVKGAYAEPPEVAFPDRQDVDASYRRMSSMLLGHIEAGRDGFAAFGTHDGTLVRWIADEARSRGLGSGAFEFEMLYGIARREQERLVSAGLPLRVLISYGEAWFPWYMRRLAERPANVWFVVRSVFR